MTYPRGKIPFMGPRASKQRFKDTSAAAKGSGWKAKQGVLFRQIDDWFVAAHLRTAASGDGFVLRVEMMAKPMLVDPLYWSDSDLGYNIRHPLSFRYFGAFICGCPVIATRVVDAETSVEMAQKIVRTADDLLPATLARLRTEPFVSIASDPMGIHDNWRMGPTLTYAQRLQNDPVAAKTIVAKLKEAPPPFKNNDYQALNIQVGGGVSDPLLPKSDPAAPAKLHNIFTSLKQFLQS